MWTKSIQPSKNSFNITVVYPHVWYYQSVCLPAHTSSRLFFPIPCVWRLLTKRRKNVWMPLIWIHARFYWRSHPYLSKFTIDNFLAYVLIIKFLFLFCCCFLVWMVLIRLLVFYFFDDYKFHLNEHGNIFKVLAYKT